MASTGTGFTGSGMSGSTSMIVKALASRSRSLSLDNAGMVALPLAVTRLSSLCHLSAKNNCLCDLPHGMANLTNLISLNLGGNCLSHTPICLGGMTCLQTLHLFRNNIADIDGTVLKGLSYLRVLNVNNNCLKELSPSVIHLQALQQLSISNNHMLSVPAELCQLHVLQELYLANNQLRHLPDSIGALKKLKKLYVQKNKLLALPQSIGRCVSLQVLDVSCNNIEVFPSEICQLNLFEFHYEHNPLLPAIPVPGVQVAEVLTLKEQAARFIVKTMASDHVLAMMVAASQQVWHSLQTTNECAVCNGPFIYSWLECVQFVSVKKIFQLQYGTTGEHAIPVRVLLCSYSCFNTPGHDYYGIGSSSRDVY